MAVFGLVMLIGLWQVYDNYYMFNHTLDKSVLQYKPDPDDPAAAEDSPIAEDMVAWLTIDGTNIDYPVMQGKDNTYYLNTDPFGAYNPEHDEMRNYRVDRMAEVAITENSVSTKAEVSPEEIAKYTKQAFKMYSGEPVETLLEFKNELLDAIFDKFGEDTPIVRKNADSCIATVVVQESPTFWGWYFQFPDRMKICSPDWLVEECERWRELRYE